MVSYFEKLRLARLQKQIGREEKAGKAKAEKLKKEIALKKKAEAEKQKYNKQIETLQKRIRKARTAGLSKKEIDYLREKEKIARLKREKINTTIKSIGDSFKKGFFKLGAYLDQQEKAQTKNKNSGRKKNKTPSASQIMDSIF
ncbi:MAG: hypothetical protein R6V14_01500 [Halanaerobiales bacterium]